MAEPPAVVNSAPPFPSPQDWLSLRWVVAGALVAVLLMRQDCGVIQGLIGAVAGVALPTSSLMGVQHG